MALKFKAKIDSDSIDAVLKKLIKLGAPLGQAEFNTIGKKSVSEMKKLISRGKFPIRGGGFSGRFPKYKDPKSYPGKLKASRPVNLKLSGDFLKALKSKATKKSVEIGVFGSKQAIKEEGHRKGANRQPKRPIIPIANKEQFARSIQKIYLDVANKKVRQISKKKN